MSEETQENVVEEENPSTAEKETKVLKKMGADIGEESITKIDLREPKEDTTEEPVEEALEESSTSEQSGEEPQTETQKSEESNQLHWKKL